MNHEKYRQQSAWESMKQARYTLNRRYIHKTDARILNMLKRMTSLDDVRTRLDANIRSSYSEMTLSNRIVTADWMPRVHDVLEHCASVLHIGIPYVLLPKELSGKLTAFTIGTDEYAYIFLSPELTASLSKSELTFLIGHECGHIALEHVMYHSIQSLTLKIFNFDLHRLSNVIDSLPAKSLDIRHYIKHLLDDWKSRSEISVDRAGLLCSQDLEASCRLLIQIHIHETGLLQKQLDDYQDAFQFTVEDLLSNSFKLHQDYPQLHQRIICLNLFARSHVYYELTGQNKDNAILYDDKQLFTLVEYVLNT